LEEKTPKVRLWFVENVGYNIYNLEGKIEILYARYPRLQTILLAKLTIIHFATNYSNYISK